MKDLYKKLISSDIFKDWKSKHKDSFLCNFTIIDNEKHFDFMNKDGTMTSFGINEEIEINEDQKVLKKGKLKPLKIDEIKLLIDEIKEIIKRKYPREKFTKEIIILQNPKEPIWSLTFVTSSFNLLNIKINMEKKIVSEIFEPLTKFMKKVK